MQVNKPSTANLNDIDAIIEYAIKYRATDISVILNSNSDIRKLCPECKEMYEASFHEKEVLNNYNVKYLYRAKGCRKCNETGYKGKLTVHEIMQLNTELKSSKNTREKLKEVAIKNGMKTFFKDCKDLVMKGETSLSELGRIVHASE